MNTNARRLANRSTLFFVVIALLMSACGPTNPVETIKSMGADFWHKADNYWSGGQVKQKNLVDRVAFYKTADSTFRLGISDLVANNQACYTDGAAAQQLIAEATLGDANRAAIASSLNLAGDVNGSALAVKCAEGNAKIADYITANRAAVRNAYLDMYTSATELNLYMNASLEVSFMNDLLSTYGDSTALWDELKKHGIGVSDWTWLPTKELFVETTDLDLCRYYKTGAFVDELPDSVTTMYTGHEKALRALYEVEINSAVNKGKGACTMYRMAALKYLLRDISSSTTKDNFAGGEDTGAYPTKVPANPTPAPTATMQ